MRIKYYPHSILVQDNQSDSPALMFGMKPDGVLLSRDHPNRGLTVEEALVDDDVVMFFLCARWFAPCREATKLLTVARGYSDPYADVKIEVVYISADGEGNHDFENFVFDYDMNWLFINPGNELIGMVRKAYPMKAQPLIVVVTRDGAEKCRITNVVPTLREAGEGASLQDLYDGCKE